MGVVYSAVDHTIGRKVVIKIPHPQAQKNDAFRERFMKEAKAMAAIMHSSIMCLYHFEKDGQGRLFELGTNSNLYYVAEYIAGKTLLDYLNTKEPEPKLLRAQAVIVALGVLEALEVIHGEEFVHRDIKPGNIMLTKEGQVKLIDFGVVRVVGTDLTADNLLSGTFKYMDPRALNFLEQGLEYDSGFDTYALGIVLYMMLCGKEPRPSKKGQEGFDFIAFARNPEQPSIQSPQLIPDIARELVLRLTARNIEDRLTDHSEIKQKIYGILNKLLLGQAA